MTYILILVFYFFSNSSIASCAGIKNCNPCYDSLLGTEKEDVLCQKDQDCIAVLHRCGDFYFLNKKHTAKYLDKKLKPNPSEKLPSSVCQFNEGWQARVCQRKSP